MVKYRKNSDESEMKTIDEQTLIIIRNRLRLLRKIHRLTQEQTADKLNIPRPTYAGYESGNRECPNAVLLKIAELFDVTTDYILGKTDYPKFDNINEILNQKLHWNGIELTESDLKPIRDLLELIVNERKKNLSSDYKKNKPMKNI